MSERDHALSDRRSFLFKLGAGGVAIAGWWLAGCRGRGSDDAPHALPAPTDQAVAQAVCPRLKADVSFGKQDGLTTLTRGAGDSATVLAVNDPGLLIIERLDGNGTVEEIAASTARDLGIDGTEAYVAKVAGFIAQAASLGLLAEPFYVTLYEQSEGA